METRVEDLSMTITNRKWITMTAKLLSLALAGCTQPQTPIDSPAGRERTQDSAPVVTALKDAYANDFLIGTAVNAAIVSGEDALSQPLVPLHFNTITAENVMKAEVVNPEPGEFNFAPADAFVAYGEQHGMFIIGHTLVWHNQTPAWFFVDAAGKPNTSEAQIERMRQHIEAVAGRYAGRVHAWDVVNEVIDDDGSYRPTTWVTAVGDGDEMVRSAFSFAAKYAPDTELYYNDFNAWRPEKRDGIVRMVKMLQAAGIRIDGIGMQGHWGLNFPRTEYIEAAIDAYAALGVKVMITELDVDVLPLTKEGQIIGTGMMHKQFQLEEFKTFLDPYASGLPADVEQQLRDRYAELFRIFHGRRDAIARVSLWGVHDGMSWKNDYPIPNRTNYPLLFDRARHPKPALEAVLKVSQK
jgi:endo-1,4-beta-xylanase